VSTWNRVGSASRPRAARVVAGVSTVMPSSSVKNASPTIRTVVRRPASVRVRLSPTAIPAACRKRSVTTAWPGPVSQLPETSSGAAHDVSPSYAVTVVAPLMPDARTSAWAVP